MHFFLIIAVTVAPAAPSSPKEAGALFDKARDLMKAGKAPEACPLFEKSHLLEPALGTLLNLADCYDKTGRLVQAYLRFNEASAWAARTHEGKREEAAKSRASALKPRLSWLSLTAAAPSPGLTVVVGEFHVELGATPQAVPVDAGEVEVIASAPKLQPWATRIKVAPAQSLSVTVPPLSPEAAAPTLTAEATPPGSVFTPEAFPAPPLVEGHPGVAQPSSPKPALGPIAVMATGGALLVAGGVGLAWSFASYDRFQRQQPGGPDAAAPTVTRAEFDTLGWVYPASLVAAGVGAAAIAVGATWRLKGASLALVPTPSGAGVVVGGVW